MIQRAYAIKFMWWYSTASHRTSETMTPLVHSVHILVRMNETSNIFQFSLHNLTFSCLWCFQNVLDNQIFRYIFHKENSLYFQKIMKEKWLASCSNTIYTYVPKYFQPYKREISQHLFAHGQYANKCSLFQLFNYQKEPNSSW